MEKSTSAKKIEKLERILAQTGAGLFIAGVAIGGYRIAHSTQDNSICYIGPLALIGTGALLVGLVSKRPEYYDDPD